MPSSIDVSSVEVILPSLQPLEWLGGLSEGVLSEQDSGHDSATLYYTRFPTSTCPSESIASISDLQKDRSEVTPVIGNDNETGIDVKAPPSTAGSQPSNESLVASPTGLCQMSSVPTRTQIRDHLGTRQVGILSKSSDAPPSPGRSDSPCLAARKLWQRGNNQTLFAARFWFDQLSAPEVAIERNSGKETLSPFVQSTNAARSDANLGGCTERPLWVSRSP